MRFAGRFARRVRAWASANGVPVIYCKAGERKHEIAERYLADHPVARPGVFLVLEHPRPRHWMIGQVPRSEEHTSELQSPNPLVCRLLLEKKKKANISPSLQLY